MRTDSPPDFREFRDSKRDDITERVRYDDPRGSLPGPPGVRWAPSKETVTETDKKWWTWRGTIPLPSPSRGTGSHQTRPECKDRVVEGGEDLAAGTCAITAPTASSRWV